MSAEKTFEDYRDSYFANPAVSADERYTTAASYLVGQLLPRNPGAPLSQLQGDTFSAFVTDLADRMKQSRLFDEQSIAQLHPSGNMPATMGHFASTLRNNNTIIDEVSPVETEMEKEVIAWLTREIAHYSGSETNGMLTTGGTLANLTGLLAARERLVNSGNWNGTSTAAVLTSEMAHYSVKKAAGILAPNKLITVEEIPLREGDFRMDQDELKKRIQILRKNGTPIMAIVAVAGETETGIIDPLSDIAEISQEEDIYLHIDGAYGAPFILGKRQDLFAGMEQSDSLTVDPHKYLYTPYPAGSIIFQQATDTMLLTGMNTDGNAYMFKEGTANYLGGRRIEGSMGGQAAAAAWAVIQTLGVDGLKLILDHTVDITDAAYREVVGSKYFRSAFEPELNSLCFYPEDKRVQNLLASFPTQAPLVEEARLALEQRTGTYIATTTLPMPGKENEREPKQVFRIVITHPYTELTHVTDALNNLEEIWEEVARTHQGQ